jgi:hypothetical protein
MCGTAAREVDVPFLGFIRISVTAARAVLRVAAPLCALLVATPAVAQESGEAGGDTVLSTGAAPRGNAWEQFTFFPELGRLDRDFDDLMLRAAYAGDINWAAKALADNKDDERALLEEKILVAEAQRSEAQATFDLCEQAARDAERLLRKYRYSSEELKAKETAAITEFQTAFLAEDSLWYDTLWPYLPPDGQDTWNQFREAVLVPSLTPEGIAVGFDRHEAMEKFRVTFSHGITIPGPDGELEVRALTTEQARALTGAAVQQALIKLSSLTSDQVFRLEEVARDKYADALQAVQKLPDCRRELVSADQFLAEQQRQLRRVELAVEQGRGGSLEADALKISQRYQAALGEVQVVDTFISNDIWASLWWKAGVALRLSGQHDLGAKRIEQAVAVDRDHQLPVDAVPPSLQTWFTAAESVIRAKELGVVRIQIHPLAELTVDGLPVRLQFGQRDLELAPGVHRFVYWLEGSDPMMQLVGVIEGEEHEFYWYLDAELNGEQEDLLGEKPVLPALPEDEKPRAWRAGVSAVGGVTLERPGFGVDLTVRFLPRFIGGQLGGGLLVPNKPYWMRIDDEMPVVARVHAGLVAGKYWERFGVVGVVGGWVDPLLGGGPMGGAEFNVGATERYRVSIDARVGFDVSKHFDELNKLMFSGGVGFWF